MQEYQSEFIRFCLDRNVLRFGEFTLKSGRISPYFFNAGLLSSGEAMLRLGRYYAQALRSAGIEYDMLFGPAYKGIPLVTATSSALAEQYGLDVPFAYDRKETKEHGEGGRIVGAPLRGRVLIVDDVITAGTAIRSSVALIRDAGAVPAGVLIALDRQERGQGDLSAVQEVEASLEAPVISIVGLAELIGHLEEAGEDGSTLASIREYRSRYGVQ